MDRPRTLCENYKTGVKALGFRRKSVSKHDERGQASILIGMMTVTLILFFAFVVNTGMLIHAKINLQNAADLAAYAGAAVQARQLNQISFLNYEMRRAYKKFLFRYYVLGGMSQDSLMDGVNKGSTGGRSWYPDRTNPSFDLKYPSVCVAFNAGDDFCRVTQATKIYVPGVSPTDMIQNTLRQQLEKIEQLRQENCQNVGVLNAQVLFLWLWNTDPQLQDLQKYLGGANQYLSNNIKMVQGLASGLGLVPKELILRQRIRTLTSYVNLAPQKKITVSEAQRMSTAVPDVAAYERTIQAFFSAFNTAGKYLFDTVDNPNNIEMEELMPDTLLGIRDIRTNFDAYATDLVLDPAVGKLADGSKPKNCLTQLTPSSVSFGNGGLPIGVYKDPTILTYYALRLQAKAKLLLSPFGDITLRAYAAAQPFGSRIGPQLDGEQLTWPGKAPICDDPRYSFNLGGNGGSKCVGQIPNLAVLEPDSASAFHGFDTYDVEIPLFKSLGLTQAAGGQVITGDHLQLGYNSAMAPNPAEKGKYNIVSSLPDPFFDELGKNGIYAFWAPLFSSDPAMGGGQDPKQEIANMLGAAQINSVGALVQGKQAGMESSLRDAITAALTRYFDLLNQGQGENGESMTLAKISDALPPTQARSSGSIFLSNKEDIKTSWYWVNDKDLREYFRTGYSVKFVSFHSLMNKSIMTDGSKTNFTNSPSTSDSESKDDLRRIQH